MIAADASVLVPAIVANHEVHEACRESATLVDAAIAHALVEVYSVLTRLPQPFTVTAVDAAAAVRSYADGCVGLPDHQVGETIERFGNHHIVGGQAYDALIATTAWLNGVILLTRDERAAHIYDRIGADVRWVAT